MKSEKINVPLWIGIGMLFLLILFMYAAPYLPFVDRELHEVKYRWTNIEGRSLILPAYPPMEGNPLGSDEKGRDNLSKLILGAKDSIYIVLIVAFIRYIVAVPLGIMAYKKRGIAHNILTALNNLFSYIPTIIAAAILLTLPFFLESEHRFYYSLILIAFLEVGRVAYIFQQQTYTISHSTFVEAGTILGLSRLRLIRSYYLPALLPEMIINFCLDIGKVMLLIGQLGVLEIFLTHRWEDIGMGIFRYVNHSLDWFVLIGEHRKDIYLGKFAFIFFPALCIMFVILTFNVLGEGLRRHFEHKKYHYM